MINNLTIDNFHKLHNEREILKSKIEEIQSRLVHFQIELSKSDLIYSMLESIYKPKIAIQEVNNPKMGHRYIGKVRILSPNGKTAKILGFSVGRVDKFKGLEDPELLKIARKKGEEAIRKNFPKYFS